MEIIIGKILESATFMLRREISRLRNRARRIEERYVLHRPSVTFNGQNLNVDTHNRIPNQTNTPLLSS